MNDDHKCEKFISKRRDGPWRERGSFREREIKQIFICSACGRERSGKFPRIVAVEKEAIIWGGIIDPTLRQLAQKLHTASRKRIELRADSVIRRLNGVHTELDIERLANVAPIRLIYRPSTGGLRLHTVHVLGRAALAEIAQPGIAAQRAIVLQHARSNLQSLTNPEALSIREILESHSADRLDERVIRVLASLAQLIERGDTLPAKAFSSEVLGNSKALLPIRGRLERLVGPLARLGIRDWGGLVIMGGAGFVELSDCNIRLEALRCVGVSSDDMQDLGGLGIPPEGILLVENLTPFQACLESFGRGASVLLVWSGGFPNRGVKKLLEKAARQKSKIRVWCDLDLGGVRIARIIQEITGGIAKPVLMDGSILEASNVRCVLTAENASRIRRDLEQRPDGLLADTLRAILENKFWVEQESLLTSKFEILSKLTNSLAAARSQ